ncbi:hypothetical protein [Agromyces sp. Marseille-Q5079]|uniref:hypothetical protein n=1 Tax=Agromyces sp. Marseille-Q5079 TaxID=3439059 RepID=UPI003D9CA65E
MTRMRAVAALAQCGFGALLIGSLTGCSPDWAESTLRIDYDEVDRGKVVACAELSSADSHRENQAAPRLIEVSDVTVEEIANEALSIKGTTTVLRDNGDERYEWTCTVTVAEGEDTLHAELTSIDRVER